MKKTYLLVVLFYTLAPSAEGQEKRNLFGRISRLVTDLDTAYVSPNKYVFALMLENSNWYEYYDFRTNEVYTPGSLRFSSRMINKIGGYFGWKWIFVGYSVDVSNLFNKKTDQRTEFGLSLYSSVAGCDIYYRKSGNAFRLDNIKDYIPHGHKGESNLIIDGLSVNMKGVNAYWIFNHRKFSYPAAYSQSTNQRRNAGSFIAGLAYSEHSIHFDKHKLPPFIQEQLGDAFDFSTINYKDISLNLGYSYNWVFAKNCLANLSLTPAIAYKHSRINGEYTNYPILDNFHFDLITRAGVTYNNAKYFAGISLVMHTYEYRTNRFSLNNSFGTIRIYAGFNFLKRKNKPSPPGG